jgi:hypothetical protein
MAVAPAAMPTNRLAPSGDSFFGHLLFIRDLLAPQLALHNLRGLDRTNPKIERLFGWPDQNDRIIRETSAYTPSLMMACCSGLAGV